MSKLTYTIGQNQYSEKLLNSVGNDITIADRREDLPDGDDMRTGDANSGRIFITRFPTPKLWVYDEGMYDIVPAYPTLGNGNIKVDPEDDEDEGENINADYTQASANYLVTEKQVSKFLADQIALLSTGIGSVHHAPVQSLAALAALASDEQTDKEIILVEDDNAIWRWDAQSTAEPTAAAVANKLVVLPTDLNTQGCQKTALSNYAPST